MASIDPFEKMDRRNHDSVAVMGFSHGGLIRPSNEDRFLIRGLPDGALLIAIADGLGIGGAGDLAADMVIAGLENISRIPENIAESELDRIARSLDSAVLKKSREDEKFNGMGSTLIGVILNGNRLYWVHVGDSRLYRLSSGILTQVTEDQTLARFLLAEGDIAAEQLPGHYSQTVMDQYIGCGFCEPETGVLPFSPGDLCILTTDGLHNQIPIVALKKILNRENQLQVTAELLLKAVLTAGGPDNITAILATHR